MAVRVLHTADWQIGRTFGGFAPEAAMALAEARFETVARIAALARERACDAVLVAGDVFDAQGVSERTIRRLFNALAPFDGPWVLLPGNHDAALAESVWTRAERLGVVPPNVHLALVPEVIRLAEPGLSVLPAPLTQRHCFDDLTAWFDDAQTPPGDCRIGLAHGAVEGLLGREFDAPNPIAADRATRARLDWLALGDWHGLKVLDARTAYSGTPEPERFRDNDAGQVLIVTLDGPGAEPIVEAERVAHHRWLRWDDTLVVPADVDALVARLAMVANDQVIECAPRGTVSLVDRRRLIEAVNAADARAAALRYDDAALRLRPTPEELDALAAGVRAQGYVGEVLAELRAELERARASLSGSTAGGAAPADTAVETVAEIEEALLVLAEWLDVESVATADERGARA